MTNLSEYGALIFSARRIMRSKGLSASLISRVDSAYLSTFTTQSDKTTAAQHFTYFALHPQKNGRSVLANVIGWNRAAELYEKVMKPFHNGTACSTQQVSSPSPATLIQAKSNSDAAEKAMSIETKPSRRQRARLRAETKFQDMRHVTECDTLSENAASEYRCSTSPLPQEDSPPVTPCETTTPESPTSRDQAERPRKRAQATSSPATSDVIARKRAVVPSPTATTIPDTLLVDLTERFSGNRTAEFMIKKFYKIGSDYGNMRFSLPTRVKRSTPVTPRLENWRDQSSGSQSDVGARPKRSTHDDRLAAHRLPAARSFRSLAGDPAYAYLQGRRFNGAVDSFPPHMYYLEDAWH